MIKSLAFELLPKLALDEFIFHVGESSSEKLLLQAITQNKSTLPDQLTQSKFCHVLDSLHFEHLLHRSDIRNQAHLHTLSATRETSAWLKATPIPSLGLDIPGPEFIIAMRIWLGIPLIPKSPSLIFLVHNLLINMVITSWAVNVDLSG